MKSLDQCSKFQILDKDRTWIDVQMVQLEPGDVYRRLHPTSGLPDPQFGLPEKRIVKKGP